MNSQIDVLLTPQSQKVRGIDTIEEEERQLVAVREEMLQVQHARAELGKRDDIIKSLRLQVNYLQGVQVIRRSTSITFTTYVTMLCGHILKLHLLVI